MSKWIRKNDTVVVISGNHKGAVGKVLLRQGDRLVIEGVNVRKKCVKRTRESGGGRIEREFPIHISNVSLVDENKAAIKLKVRFNAEQRKELYFLRGQEAVIYRTI